jgi:8-oxo-dGTP pyrophosphatase MutT (NUDIX family)
MQVHAVSKVLVFDADERLLILQRSETDDRRPLEWDLPGGHVETGEDLAAAASFELFEEAGIALEVRSLRLVYAMTDLPGKDNSVTWTFFLAHVEIAEVKLSDEHVAYRWVPLAEALQLITYERQVRVLRHLADNDLLHANFE